jgi:hypothetical protein
MLDLKTLDPQYVTDENGEQTAVIIPIETFRDLLEDIDEEPTIHHEEVIGQLKRDGVLPI